MTETGPPVCCWCVHMHFVFQMQTLSSFQIAHTSPSSHHSSPFITFSTVGMVASNHVQQ